MNEEKVFKQEERNRSAKNLPEKEIIYHQNRNDE